MSDEGATIGRFRVSGRHSRSVRYTPICNVQRTSADTPELLLERIRKEIRSGGMRQVQVSAYQRGAKAPDSNFTWPAHETQVDDDDDEPPPSGDWKEISFRQVAAHADMCMRATMQMAGSLVTHMSSQVQRLEAREEKSQEGPIGVD